MWMILDDFGIIIPQNDFNQPQKSLTLHRDWKQDDDEDIVGLSRINPCEHTTDRTSQYVTPEHMTFFLDTFGM